MNSIREFASSPELAETTAEEVAKALRLVLDRNQTAVLAVPGGSTARLVLPVLASKRLSWPCVRIVLTDERWVPSHHPDSNEGLVRSLVHPIVDVTVTGLYTAAASPDDAIATLEQRIPAPDVVLLGMGEDGHIASLFPSDIANNVTTGFAVVRQPDHIRVTLTPAALKKIQHVFLAITGEPKWKTLQRAFLPGSADELPVRHILERAQVFAAH